MCGNFVIKYKRLLYGFKHENKFLPNSKFLSRKMSPFIFVGTYIKEKGLFAGCVLDGDFLGIVKIPISK